MPPHYKPKILFSVTVAETAYFFLREQIPFLLQKGYAVEIVCGEGSWVKLADVKRMFDVPVHTLPLTRNMSLVYDIYSLVKLYLLMRKIKPDILHASTPKAALYALVAGWLARVPVRIYLVRGIAYYCATGIVRFLHSIIFKLACCLAHAVICVSESNKTFMLSNNISSREKTVLLSNGSSHGVDGTGKFDPGKADKFRIDSLKNKYMIVDGDILFGFTGRIVKDKGIEELVATWILFIKNHKKSHCFIIGHKESRDGISPDCLREIESEPSLHLVDDIIDPYDYYCLFDIFIFPSHREGFPNSILEAAAMGLPVITTDALGCVDAVKNGETGYIVPVGDAAKLLEIMDTLYYDGDLRAKLGNNARNFVLRRFNSHDVNSAFDDFVQNLCIKRGRFAARRIAIVTTVPATLYHLFSNQIDRIKREGFNVFLISSAGDQWICAKDVENKYGIKVHCVPFLRTFSLFSDMYTIIALCSLLAKLHLNVIYYCTPKASLLTAIAAFFMRVPFRIYSLFGQVYYGKKGLMKNILFLAEFLTCSFSHRVILMSKSNLAYIQKEKLCAPRKMGLLGKGTNQGVDAKGRFNPDSIDARNVDCLRNRLNIPENMVVFGYMGRLVKDKGIRELFNAWKDIRKETLQCTLLLIGPKKEPRDKLPDTLFDSIANDSRIRLIEPVTDPEMYYALMNILILPSYREGFPNVVLEAAAMRLPVITTDAIGCIDSVIENETGFIVPFKNIEKLKEKMKVLLHNPQLRAEMGFKARERVLKDFNAEKITEELIYLINNKEFCARVKSV